MKHSIIIPCQGREQNLAVCNASIEYSASVCGESDYEIIVIRKGDDPPVVLRSNETMPFWKNHLLNRGIEAAKGDVLTFLDADAVVGPKFMENANRLQDASLTKLAYRVRYAEYDAWPGSWSGRFASYDAFSLAYEDSNGNSQFSIRRDKLGSLRYDERYFGRGLEDLEMNRRLAALPDYKCEIVTDSDHAMFHIKNELSLGFNSDRFNRRNQRLYDNESCTWAFCHTRPAGSALYDAGFRGRIEMEDDMRFFMCEILEQDVVLMARKWE
jgi:glycosyltransferase involved in cell wall biosynthesis